MKNPRSTGPPQLEAKPAQTLLSDDNSLQLDNGNARPDQTAELTAEEVNSAELSPRAPSSDAPEERAVNSLQLDSANSRPDQAAELRADEVTSAELSPRARNSEAPAKERRARELISAHLSPPTISTLLPPPSRTTPQLPPALLHLPPDSITSAI